MVAADFLRDPQVRRCLDGVEPAWTLLAFDILRALRQETGGDRPIVLFCTTESDMTFITQAIEAGANEYIMKPFDKEIIESKFSEVGLV